MSDAANAKAPKAPAKPKAPPAPEFAMAPPAEVAAGAGAQPLAEGAAARTQRLEMEAHLKVPPTPSVDDQERAATDDFLRRMRTIRAVAVDGGFPRALEALRKDGWMVACHNDYRQGGARFTFWLFTKGDRCIQGEGPTDLDAIRAAVKERGAQAFGDAMWKSLVEICGLLDAPAAKPRAVPAVVATPPVAPSGAPVYGPPVPVVTVAPAPAAANPPTVPTPAPKAPEANAAATAAPAPADPDRAAALLRFQDVMAKHRDVAVRFYGGADKVPQSKDLDVYALILVADEVEAAAG